jgi:hypothetical protein
MSRLKVSPAMVVAIVALVAATTGTALAATGQLVNIVDPTNAANAAKVDASGALKTTTAGSVRVTPSTSFSVSKTVPNFYANPTQTEVLKTTASIALNRIQVAHTSASGPVNWEGALFYGDTNSSGTCLNGTRIAALSIRQGETTVDPFPTPILLKPFAAGRAWCLRASIGRSDESAVPGHEVYLGISGIVTAGTVTPAVQQGRESARDGAPSLFGD